MNDKRFPLQWPAGWKRTQNPQRSQFKPGSASNEGYNILDELKRLGATNVIISSNMEYKPDGTPYARQTRLYDTGVAVYFTLNGAEQSIPCDKWITVEENMRAIWKTIEALRGLDRWGAKEMVAAAFRGFTALPESIIVGSGQARAWYEVLQVSQDADPEIVKRAWKTLIAKYHPDNQETGDPVKFDEVQRAYKEATS